MFYLIRFILTLERSSGAGECLGECGMGPNVEAEVDGRLKIFNDVKSRDDLSFAS